MKKQHIIFWTTTGIFSAAMLFSAFSYLTSPSMEAAFQHLGFSDYFRIELAVAKILGALALLLPFVPRPAKILAYCGFLITVISAFIAHTSNGDPIAAIIAPLVFLALLVVSYSYFDKLSRRAVQQS